MTSKRNTGISFASYGDVQLIPIQGLTPKFPRSFVGIEQLNKRRLK